MRNAFFSFIGLMIFCGVSCRSTKSISGTYRSKFAVSGYFVTSIQLFTDSTFTYRTIGHLMCDTSNGHYTTEGKYLILYHEPFNPDSAEVNKYGKEMVLSGYGLSINNHLGGPEKYLIRSKKLFLCNQLGKIEIRRYGYSKHKRFFIFGSNFFQRRYYLKRLD